MTYVIPMQFLILVQLTIVFIDPRSEAVGITTKGDIQVLKEFITACEQTLRRVRPGVDGRLTVEDDNSICKVGGHDEIVLNDEGGLLSVHNEAFDDTGGDYALLGVKVGAWFIDEIDVGGNPQSEDNGDTLEFTTGEVLHFLIDEVVEFEGLVDISLELRAEKGGFDFLEKQLPHGACELGGDFLRFHRDVHLRHAGSAVWFLSPSQHTTESRLARAVLTHHNDNLGIRELARLDFQMKAAQGFLHGRVLITTILLGDEVIPSFSNAEGKGFFSKP